MRHIKIIAVASGKGGVGKTTTSVNIAINAVREGKRVALVDSDPLSNIMSLLDQPVSKQFLPENLIDPANQTYTMCKGLDIVFPKPKKDDASAAGLTTILLTTYRFWLNNRYDLVIIDMPAGVPGDNSFPYLSNVDILVLVTNPEPTSHVATGRFMKAIMKLWGDRPIYLWHNKYIGITDNHFDTDDVVSNYNKNVNEEERIESPWLIPVAYVPSDPALDLIKADPPILLDLYRSLLDILDGLFDACLPIDSELLGEGDSRAYVLISYLLRRFGTDEDPTNMIDAFENLLEKENTSANSINLPQNIKENLKIWLVDMLNSPLRKQLAKTREVVDIYINALEKDESQFSISTHIVSQHDFEREMIAVLKALTALPDDSPMKKLAGLLFYRYSLIKLFANDTAHDIIMTILPRRNENGQSVRDRKSQIARIMIKDESWQQYYLSIVKKLYPVVSSQLDYLNSTYELHGLLYRQEDGSIDKMIYVKLFSETLYEIINSGLGVISGFRFRPSSRAFQEGFNNLFMQIEQNK